LESSEKTEQTSKQGIFFPHSLKQMHLSTVSKYLHAAKTLQWPWLGLQMCYLVTSELDSALVITPARQACGIFWYILIPPCPTQVFPAG